MAASSSSNANVDKEQQKIIEGYTQLRQAQRAVIDDIRHFEGELRELYGVINALKKLPGDRTVYKRAGTILLQRTVEEELARKYMEFNRNAVSHKCLSDKLVKVSEELNEYQKEHNIRVLTEKQMAELEAQQAAIQAEKEKAEASKTPSKVGAATAAV